MYRVMDTDVGKDLVTGQYVEAARWAASPSFDGCPINRGNLGKTIFDEDKMSLMRAIQGAGVSSPSLPGYVYHENRSEIEYALTGCGCQYYPDGSTHQVQAGDCMFHAEGQPHRLKNMTDVGIELCIGVNGSATERFPGQLGADRGRWDQNEYYCRDGGYRIAHRGQGQVYQLWGGAATVEAVLETPGLSSGRVVAQPAASQRGGFYVSRNADEMALVTAGAGLLIFPDEVFALQKDIAYYIFADQPYKIVATGDRPLHMLAYWSASAIVNVQCAPALLTEKK
ncbi:Uncharacterized conserved protein%2C contains double-stranded beta-helix domain [Anaerotruncus sp. 2789STDY5834896]|uniref:Uncharacterized conserved protein, contains double-stranded beta-helix domain n=1 Tax=uncultured Anaerotruncus sp. TaxID=905011 RepID=A0A1C6H824_9FIRM|nr:Uncharacterized conserved protein%2C contains double-stranded beta-helix domain [uncultured Anaerotruncus sp.]